MDESGFRHNVAIVGLGLIGGSFAKAFQDLRRQDAAKADSGFMLDKVSGLDMDENTLRRALDLGIIDEASTAAEKVLPNADLVIIALYPEDTVRFVEENRAFFKAGALVTDVCGVKKSIVDKMVQLLPSNVEFVGGHPMAGRESKGLDMAASNIFHEANYIITPHEGNKHSSIDMIETMARAIGCRNIVKVSPEEHDRIITIASQLPHVLAISLMNSGVEGEKIESFIGGSFKDATRVAMINSALWLQIFSLNSDYLLEEIDRFQETLTQLKTAIRQQDRDFMRGFLETAAKKRKRMV